MTPVGVPHRPPAWTRSNGSRIIREPADRKGHSVGAVPDTPFYPPIFADPFYPSFGPNPYVSPTVVVVREREEHDAPKRHPPPPSPPPAPATIASAPPRGSLPLGRLGIR
jgi:hypothetical protein